MLRRKLLLSIFSLCLVLGTGCSWLLLGAAAGGAGMAYSMGRLTATKDVSLETLYNASLRACDNLKFRISTKQLDGLNGNIVVQAADNKEVHIKQEKLADKSTKLTIYCLPIPDKNRTINVYNEIEKELGMPTP